MAETATKAIAIAKTIAAKAMKVAAEIAAAIAGPIAVAKATAIASGGGLGFHGRSMPHLEAAQRCPATNESGAWKLAAEQRRFADRQSQRVAAQPVQRDLAGENLYPVAVAA